MKGAGATRSALAAGVFAILAGGCAVSIPSETFYTLDVAIAGRTSASAAASKGPGRSPASTAAVAVHVEEALVPQVVDRPQLVVSVSDVQVQPLEQQRWAEPLRAQIARVVALDLARLLPSARVSTSEDVLDGVAPAQGYRLSLDVQRFETRPGESAEIEVEWAARRGAGEVTASGRERVREPATEPGYDGAVRAHRRALATVSRTIATALQSGSVR